jgi:hypothetical protein
MTEQTRLQDVLDAIGDFLMANDKKDAYTARVADALLDYAGPPSANGVNNGSDAKLNRVANEVKKRFPGRGEDRFDFDYLRQLRRTAFNFPPGERSPGIPFSWFICAGKPEILKGAMAQAEKDERKCSAGYIRRYRKHLKETSGKDRSDALVLRSRLEKHLVEDIQFYIRAADKCAKVMHLWSDAQRAELAAKREHLIRALRRLNVESEVVPLREAAE